MNVTYSTAKQPDGVPRMVNPSNITPNVSLPEEEEDENTEQVKKEDEEGEEEKEEKEGKKE